MSDDDTKEWAEKNFNAMKNRMQDIETEMRNSKPRENISVRRVDSDNLEGQDEDQIVVEHSVQRWYSINYFKQMMNDSNNASTPSEAAEEDDEDTIF